MLILLCTISGILLFQANAAVVRVTTTAELVAAVDNVVAGDEIIIATGTYFAPSMPMSYINEAHLTITTPGTADNRITLRGEDPRNPPMISGLDTSFWSVIRLSDGADYWTIQDLILSTADKGIVVDKSNFVELKRLQIMSIGEEGIHIRDGSSNTMIEDCQISDTGLLFPGFGEAIYVGSDRDDWVFFSPDVAFTTIRRCKIGPFVRGEPFDVKEGATDTIIEFCTVDARGLSGENFADSFIDIKGTRTFVRFNTFNRNGNQALAKGIAIIDREVELSADQNVIHSNTFNYDNDPSIAMVEAGSRTSETVAFDNKKIPSGGSDYTGSVSETCCPEWYVLPNESMPAVPTSTLQPLLEPTPTPSRFPTPDPTPEPSQNPTRSPSPRPTPLPTPGPSPMPTLAPSRRPSTVPTPNPTSEPSPNPTSRPSPRPTPSPTPEPSPIPTLTPSHKPSRIPTLDPTSEPSPYPRPTPSPTPEPSPIPTLTPSHKPSRVPTPDPTTEPSPYPTPSPSPRPTPSPTPEPSPMPTVTPSHQPSRVPLLDPTLGPSSDPSPRPTPTHEPSPIPTLMPSNKPSRVPTPDPTLQPSPDPSPRPTQSPTHNPSPVPTLTPSHRPSRVPTPDPTVEPSPDPSPRPTSRPTPKPSPTPTLTPSHRPSRVPTPDPTLETSSEPTPVPTLPRSHEPSRFPSPLPSLIRGSPKVSPEPSPDSKLRSSPRPSPSIPASSEPSNSVFPKPSVLITSHWPVKSPTSSFSAGYCDDSDFGTFLVASTGEVQRCVWLAARPEFLEEVCSSASGAGTCPELCRICTDDCDDTDRKFSVGDARRDCLWLRLRPQLKPEICLPGSAAALACPETCDVCDGPVQRNMPHSLTPTDHPTPRGFNCDDDKTKTFLVEELQEQQGCVWLAARPEYIETYCAKNHTSKAYDICEETCNKCYDDCEDTNAEFEIDGRQRSCLWLSLRPEVQSTVCVSGNPANTICPETCDTCDGIGTLPPIPAPLNIPMKGCDDSKLDKFFVAALSEFMPCVWLAARPEWQASLCLESDASHARLLCPETCGACTDNCEDTNMEIIVGESLRDCLWLSLRPDFQDELCIKEEVKMACPETCDVCDV